MKSKIILLLTLFLLSVLSGGGNRFVSAANEVKHVKFQITTIAENAASGERQILAQTIIKGLPGTDFDIDLQTERFRMEARFLSDLIAPDKLKIKAKLNTRRLYGQSERGLPLYEEDVQNQKLEMNFDEAIVLLPFGHDTKDGTETLKIEITPTLLDAVSADEKAQPLKIEFGKLLPNGEISVRAAKIPHRFTVEAILTADGREISRGTSDCLLEEEQKIVLQLAENAGAEIPRQSLAVNFTVDGYTRNRPVDTVDLKFNLRPELIENQNNDGSQEQFFSSGMGVSPLGKELNYQVRQANSSGGKKFELKFKVRLAAGEESD